jgi:hypothetical protein
MQELLTKSRVWYAGAINKEQGVVCRSYYPSEGCGMQELLPDCRVWYAGAITRVQGVVCRSLPECWVWYAGAYPVQGVVCRSYYLSAGCGMQEK